MAINLDAIKKRLSTIQGTDKKKGNQWKPEAGLNTIRIVPYQFNKDNPFLELYFHYEVGKKNYLSLETFGETDPIVEFSEKLKQTGIKEDWLLGRKLEPTLRTYVPIIVRGKEKEGVKFWGFGKTIYQELLAIISDPDYGDITDLKSGRDIVVEYKTPQEANNTYGKIAIRIKPNVSVATDDKDVANLILTGQTDIYTVYEKVEYDVLKNALQDWLEPKEEGETVQQPTTPAVTKSAPKPTDDLEMFNEKPGTAAPKTVVAEVKADVAPTTSAVKDVADAFDDIFNQK